MPLRLTSQRYFTETVHCHPAEPGGKPQSFDATFRVMDPEADFPATADGLRDFLRASLADLSGIEDEAGTPVPFGPEIVEELLKPGCADIVAALNRAYVTGLGRAKAGN